VGVLSRSLLAGLVLAAVLVPVGLAVVPESAQAAQPVVVETELNMPGTPEADGRPVAIDVSLFTTDARTPRPAIVLAHGFGGSKADSAGTARQLAGQGYAVITFTARGFGRSGGRIHLNHPQFEGADARRLVDLAASRPEVSRTGSDPVIGFTGASYGGAISLLVAGLDRRVDAIAPTFTWNSLTTALFPQHATAGAARSLADVTPTTTPGVFKQRWASLFFLSGGGGGSGDLCGRFTAALCRGYLETAESGSPSPGLLALLEESDLGPVLGDIAAPTMLVHGEQDTLFGLDQADANLRGLATSTPAKMQWVEGGHDAEIDIDALLPELESWFGHYLKRDGSPADSAFGLAVPEAILVGNGDRDEVAPTRTTAAYPGRGAPLLDQRLRLSGERQMISSPPGGTPAALTNLPGTGGVLSSLSSVAWRTGGGPMWDRPASSSAIRSSSGGCCSSSATCW
jgi:ABC-2 type transport system ATP-binding protein